jgi:hypothetical protein
MPPSADHGLERPHTDTAAHDTASRGDMLQIRQHLDSVCDLILVLSHSDGVVKATVSHPETFRKLLVLMEQLPGPLLAKMLQAVRSLTEDPQAVRQIQEAGGVPALVDVLRRGQSRSNVMLSREMQLPLIEVRHLEIKYLTRWIISISCMYIGWQWLVDWARVGVPCLAGFPRNQMKATDNCTPRSSSPVRCRAHAGAAQPLQGEQATPGRSSLCRHHPYALWPCHGARARCCCHPKLL